jgi:hypothetical protein
MEGIGDSSELRRIRLRFAGICAGCGRPLEQGTEALHNPALKNVWCFECRGPAKVLLPTVEPGPIQAGVAGKSAQREYERRVAKREAKVKERFGNRLGGVVLAITDDPQSTKAWAQGAKGEQKVAESLAKVPGIIVLHDRAVAMSLANVDHIVIAPAGVFVVDAKKYNGEVRVRDRGGLFKTDLRLYVGSHDCSALADAMGWQVREVLGAMVALELQLPLTPVLCFADATWPLLFPPSEFRGVRLESPRSLSKLIVKSQALSASDIESIGRALSTAFPPR